MAQELQPLDISTNPQLAQLADEVERTQRPRRLRRGSKDVAVLMPATTTAPVVFVGSPAQGRGTRQSALLRAIDAGYQSVPALDPPRSLQEMTDIAAQEHAEHAAREGL